MHGRRDEEEGSNARWELQRVWALAIVAGGLLLFTWPFVRDPPLAIGSSYAHLLGAWVTAIGALAGMARALRATPGRKGRSRG